MNNEIENLELKIAKFLRYGVFLSGGILLIGWLLQLSWTADPFFVFSMYGRVPLTSILKVAIANKQYGILISYTGLFILISLPLIRVLLTAYLFMKQKERALAMIAISVFILLMVSMSLGIEL